MREQLDDSELETYARQIVLADIGYEGQLKLRNARVCLIGLGGLGSPTALKLTGMGVGYLRLVDRDIVSRSDLHRQNLYDRDSVGRPKVEAALARLRGLNPDVEIEVFPESFGPRNAAELIEGMDVVIDGLDRPEPRYLLNRACWRLNVPYVFGAAVESYGNASTLVPGRSACLECFMGGLGNEDLPVCGVVGVHPSVLGVISAVQVAEAVRLLTGKEPNLLNRLFYADLKSFEFNVLNLGPSGTCAVCSGEPAGEPQVVEERYFEEGCGREGRRTFFLLPRERFVLDLERLEGLLRNKGFPIVSSGPCGITFEPSVGRRYCLLRGGELNCQVAADAGGDLKKEIFDMYRSLLVDGLDFSPSIMPE